MREFGECDPFVAGPLAVSVSTVEALDASRARPLPYEIWQPEEPGLYPLILFSHSSGGKRRQSSFLCSYLSSHGYIVAAPDHYEAAGSAETPGQKADRVQAWIANRVPDIRFILDHVLASGMNADPARIGIVGHSFGGWTALAAPDTEQRIGAVVALAPGGSSQIKPGILPLTLGFHWGRAVPVLFLVAENDVSLPLAGMYELFERAPEPKQMVVLRRADHLHFMDDVEQRHEAVRAMTFTGELAWIAKEMLPISELCSGANAQLLIRGLTLGHMDAVLKDRAEARRFLAGDLEAELAKRGLNAHVMTE